MIEEECMNSLNDYSKEMEDNINNIISLRSLLSSIQSFNDYIKEKGKVVQLMFEIEDLLRNSCQFIKQNYFKIKQVIKLDKNKNDNYAHSYDYNSKTPFDNSANSKQDDLKNGSHLIKLKEENEGWMNIKENRTQQQSNDEYYNNEDKTNNDLIKIEDNNANLNSKEEKPFNTIGEIDLKEKSDIIDAHVKIQIYHEDNNDNENQTNERIEERKVQTSKSRQQFRKEIYVDDPYQEEYNSTRTERENNAPDREFKRNSSDSSITKKKCYNNIKKNRLYQIRNQNTKRTQSRTQSQTQTQTQHAKLFNFAHDGRINYSDIPIDPFQTKQKVTLIANMIIKLKTNEDLNEMMEQLFGKDMINRLMDDVPDDEFILAVKQSINTIELLQKRDRDQEEEEEEAAEEAQYQIQTQFQNKLQQKENPILKNEKKSSVHLDYNINNKKPIIISKDRKNQSTNESSSLFLTTMNKSMRHNTNLYPNTNNKKSFADKLLEKNGFKSKIKPHRGLSRAQKQTELLSQKNRDNNNNGSASYSFLIHDSFNYTKGIILSQKSSQIQNTQKSKKASKIKLLEEIKGASQNKKGSPFQNVI